jgi:hypothetical protein
MLMTRSCHKLKATTAALMLLVAQVFGLPLGFGCDCSGDVRLVKSSFCIADSCHEGAPHSHEHEHDGVPCDAPDHDHEHYLITADLSLEQAPASSLPQVLPLIAIPVWGNTCLSIIEGHRFPAKEAPRDRKRDALPPPSVLVKRSVVLLV